MIDSTKITIGYNRSGQDFFDWLKDKNIHSVFFSPTHNGYNQKFNEEDFYNEFIKLNTYNIPMNLLLNSFIDEKRWDELIYKYISLCNLTSVTCLNADVAKEIKIKYPMLELHLSVQTSNYKSYKSCFVFDYVNINGAYNFNKNKIENYRKYSKIKFIANEGCIVGRSKNYENLNNFGMFECKCCNNTCQKMEELYPWLALTRINLYKEFLNYIDIDLIKFASREISLNNIKLLYDYWTSDTPTKIIGNKIEIKNYNAYNKWIEKRLNDCPMNCLSCKFCEQIYKEIICN